MWFVNHIKMGRAMLAVSEDKGAAQLMGINVNVTIAMTFAIGSALAELAGVLLCSAYPTLQPTTGAMPGIKAFTAAVFGGIGSIPGAMVGGVLLGVIEILSKAYISTQLADAMVFAVLIIVLLVRPTGLMGKRSMKKCEVEEMKCFKTTKKSTKSNLVTYGMVLAFYIVIQLLLSAGVLNHFMQGMLVPICTYVVLAISLNLTVCILGELSLGYAEFMSVGAFSGALFWMISGSELPLAVGLGVSMVIGGIVAGIFGLLIGIPVLRLRGDYLAIVTLAFEEIIKNVLNTVYLGVDPHGLHVSLKEAASLNMEADGKIIINRMLIYAVILIAAMIFNQSPKVIAWRAQVMSKFAETKMFQRFAQMRKGRKGEA